MKSLAACLALAGLLTFTLFRATSIRRQKPSPESSTASTGNDVEQIILRQAALEAIAPPETRTVMPSLAQTQEQSSIADVTELAAAKHDLEIALATKKAIHERLEEAREVVRSFTVNEFIARQSTGPYSVMERHVPGVELHVKDHPPRLHEAFIAEDGEWRRVQLPPEEYPELYALSELILNVEDDLEKGKASLKPAR